MKKVLLLFVLTVTLFACKDVDEIINPNYNMTFNFTQNWDGEEITNPDYQTTVYTNANGEEMTISKLNYLISDITFTDKDGDVTVIEGYNIMNARDGVNTQYTPSRKISEGEYTVSFTFGFDDEDNIDDAYTELNSPPWGWGVPDELGGGYHFMRLEGMFADNTGTQTPYLYHAIRAAIVMGENPETEDTSFKVDLGTVTISQDTSIEIKMNVAEWFKNPHQWSLNELSSNLMMNAEAQRMISANGKSVFSLGTVE
ncbi:MAG: hypothetical protein CMC07_08880 [Flavobacteriaceae bacterium]|nr:hypothetical protein [Flavobacteriaceae bacterium]|tara:strand:+ start:14971 stop:15738 length:768 start_codon:yes stop_codon:yes gene_type:complete